MTQILPPLRLTGATLLRDGTLQRRSLGLAGGRIRRGAYPALDLAGYLLLPGIVDPCGEGLARRAAPATPAALDGALAGAEREAAAQGITTLFLAQEWSWEGGPRSPEAALAAMAALADRRPRALIDMRLRLGIAAHPAGHPADDPDQLICAAELLGLGHAVFTDRIEALSRMRQAQPEDFTRLAADLGQTAAALSDALDAAEGRARAVPRRLCRLAEGFDRLGVPYGSRGDPDGETRERHSMIGARIAECPATRRAAAAARAMMSPVILSAWDVLQGRGPAAGLLAEGLCDALASGPEPDAPARAVWQMVDRGLAPLPRAWALVSSRPAEILRLPDRGRLDPGMRADVAIVNARSRTVEATISAGRLVHATGEAAARFAAFAEPRQLAAE